MGEYSQVHHTVDPISLPRGELVQPLRHEGGLVPVVRSKAALVVFDYFSSGVTRAGRRGGAPGTMIVCSMLMRPFE